MAIIVGKVYRDGESLSWWGRYTGGDTVPHGEKGIEEGYTVHMVWNIYREGHSPSWWEGILEKTLSVMVWKVYREGHSPSWCGRYTGRDRRQVFSLHTQSRT